MSESTATISRSLIPWGYSCEYNLRRPMTPELLSLFVDKCLSFVLPAEMFINKSITNLKGREKALLIDSSITYTLKPQKEELLCIVGKVYTNEAQLKKDNLIEADPFSLRLHTAFESFSGMHDITHRIEQQREGALPNHIKLQTLGRIFPIKLECFRIGLEFFESRFITGMLGFAPNVTQTLLIEASCDQLLLKINLDAIKDIGSLPFSRFGFFDRLDATFRAILSFELINDYLAKTHQA